MNHNFISSCIFQCTFLLLECFESTFQKYILSLLGNKITDFFGFLNIIFYRISRYTLRLTRITASTAVRKSDKGNVKIHFFHIPLCIIYLHKLSTSSFLGIAGIPPLLCTHNAAVALPYFAHFLSSSHVSSSIFLFCFRYSL